MNKPVNVDVLRYDHSDDFYRAALATVVHMINDSLAAQGRCSVALSGGSTPKRLFEILAEEKNIIWNDVHLFWVDERCVPADHPASNFNMTNEALLSKITMPQQNVHRVVTEGLSPAEVSSVYEVQLKEFFADELSAFDIILLGMGADGHTASLFPGDRALGEKERWVVAVDGKRGTPPVPRITLTLPIINNARNVLFLVVGESKRYIVDEILSDRYKAAKKYPAALVQPMGKLVWFVS